MNKEEQRGTKRKREGGRANVKALYSAARWFDSLHGVYFLFSRRYGCSCFCANGYIDIVYSIRYLFLAGKKTSFKKWYDMDLVSL